MEGDHVGRPRWPARKPGQLEGGGPFRHRAVLVARSPPARTPPRTPGSGRARHCGRRPLPSTQPPDRPRPARRAARRGAEARDAETPDQAVPGGPAAAHGRQDQTIQREAPTTQRHRTRLRPHPIEGSGSFEGPRAGRVEACAGTKVVLLDIDETPVHAGGSGAGPGSGRSRNSLTSRPTSVRTLGPVQPIQRSPRRPFAACCSVSPAWMTSVDSTPAASTTWPRTSGSRAAIGPCRARRRRS